MSFSEIQAALQTIDSTKKAAPVILDDVYWLCIDCMANTVEHLEADPALATNFAFRVQITQLLKEYHLCLYYARGVPMDPSPYYTRLRSEICSWYDWDTLEFERRRQRHLDSEALYRSYAEDVKSYDFTLFHPSTSIEYIDPDLDLYTRRD